MPEEAREAARGMGYGPGRLLFGVELPLALPALMAGVRIATVSAVALTTVGAIVGFGGLGNLIYEGMDSFFKAQVLTASVICVLLAVVGRCAAARAPAAADAMGPPRRTLPETPERYGGGEPCGRARRDAAAGR